VAACGGFCLCGGATSDASSAWAMR
jgi:hypothetical protein